MADPNPEKSVLPPPGRPVTPTPSPLPGTYVIMLPKNQIFRVPPPENALHYRHFSNPKSSSRLRCFLCSCSLVVLFFLLLLASAAAISFYVFRPKSPEYTVNHVSIKSPSPDPDRFDITFTAVNPSKKIGISYQKGSSVQVFYKQVNLFVGVLPQFFQPSKNTTMLKTVLERSSATEMTSSVHDQLVAAERTGTVQLKVVMRAPVRFKLGSVQTWTMNVKMQCDLTVDKLTGESKIESKNCDSGVHLWYILIDLPFIKSIWDYK